MDKYKLKFENGRNCTIECDTTQSFQDNINEAENRFNSECVEINDKPIKKHSLGGFLVGATIGSILGNSVPAKTISKTATGVKRTAKNVTRSVKKQVKKFDGGGSTDEERYCRLAEDTGKGINEGFVIGDGDSYFESEDNLVKHLRELDYEDADGNSSKKIKSKDDLLEFFYNDEYYYYTEWDCDSEIEDQGYYYTRDGKEIEIASKGKKLPEGKAPRSWNKDVREYMFFVWNTRSNKCWAGNEYENDAKDELKEFLLDNPELPLKVLSKRAITNKKINPLAYESWARSTEIFAEIRGENPEQMARGSKISGKQKYVLLFITNDDHSIAEWFEIPESKFTSELEDLIFSKGYGFSEYYESDGEYKFNRIDESEKLKKFLSTEQMARGSKVKSKTNTQMIKALVKDLENTPYSIGLAILRERILTYSENDLRSLEKNPKNWENPIISLGMYKDYYSRVNKELNFDSRKDNVKAIKGLVKDLENSPYSIGLVVLRERLYAYAENDLKAMEKNPDNWSNPFISLGMYKDYANRVIENLKFEYETGGLINKEDGSKIVGIKSKQHESSLDQNHQRPKNYDESNSPAYILRVFNSGKAYLYNFFDKYGNKYEYEELVENSKYETGGNIGSMALAGASPQLAIADEVSKRLPATTSAIDKRLAERIYSDKPSMWEDRGLRYSGGGKLGDEITFKHWSGDIKTGTITEDLGEGNFEVQSGYGKVLVHKDDIQSGGTQFKKGGLSPEDKLKKELNSLQRQLNSQRLSTYREGDTSQEEMDRQRERASKLKRFSEILLTLRNDTTKTYGKGGMTYSLTEFPIYAGDDGIITYQRNAKKDIGGKGSEPEYAVSIYIDGKKMRYEDELYFDTEQKANLWVQKLNDFQKTIMTPTNKNYVRTYIAENDDRISELIYDELRDLNAKDFQDYLPKTKKKKFSGGGGTPEKDYGFDYMDIGQFSVPETDWRKYSDAEFEDMGEKIVKETYKGDLGRAYDEIVHNKFSGSSSTQDELFWVMNNKNTGKPNNYFVMRGDYMTQFSYPTKAEAEAKAKLLISKTKSN